jgi:hypothetical protein
MNSLLPGSLDAKHLVDVRIRGPEQALNELCQHWLFGHALVERRPEEALFRMGEPSLRTFVPYFLLPYGTAIRIVEPGLLVDKLAEVSSRLAAHYAAMKSDLACETERKGE